MDFSLNKEQQDIIKAARKFAKGEFPDRALEFDRAETFDLNIWKKACELGFVGVFIDEKYGGAGYGFFEHCLINEEFWAVEPGMAMQVLSATFGSELLLLYANEQQKQELLPRLTLGEAIMGTAITEPDAGCDVTGAVTTAIRDGSAWVINGTKMFATNGNVADFLRYFAERIRIAIPPTGDTASSSCQRTHRGTPPPKYTERWASGRPIPPKSPCGTFACHWTTWSASKARAFIN